MLSSKPATESSGGGETPSEATSSCHVARGTRPVSSRRTAHSSESPP